MADHPLLADLGKGGEPRVQAVRMIKGSVMKALYLSVLATLLLIGCANPAHLLVRGDDALFIAGELVHDRCRDNHLVLQTPNRRYEARGFVVERQTDLAALRKRYFIANPKHWERIFAGLDTDHVVYSVETIAKSAEGHEVSCRLMWTSGAKPAGVCADPTGTEFPVRFEQYSRIDDGRLLQRQSV